MFMPMCLFVWVGLAAMYCMWSPPLVTATVSTKARAISHYPVAWYAKHSQWLMGNSRHGKFLPFPPTLFFALLEWFSHTFQPMLRVASGLESVSMLTLMFMALRGCLWVSVRYLSCYWTVIKHNSFFLTWIHSMVFKLELNDNQQLFANVNCTWSKPPCCSIIYV